MSDFSIKIQIGVWENFLTLVQAAYGFRGMGGGGHIVPADLYMRYRGRYKCFLDFLNFTWYMTYVRVVFKPKNESGPACKSTKALLIGHDIYFSPL